ncbi:MAG TPA: hypothetical protein VKR56_00100 [Candidatus Cybelea sp.]|nr:hypothetical protein [Candidatus Cybelea sp.]
MDNLKERTPLGFDDEAEAPTTGVALIFDLGNFSQFFTQPDVQEYVTKFLNIIFEALSIVIFGGAEYYTPEKTALKPLLTPVHEKFLGDGALYLWNPTIEETPEFSQNLVNRLWNLQNWYPEVLAKARIHVPVVELPSSIRFGLSRGTVYELTRRDGAKEYIGFCINLASRLQRYCPELNFLASARINVEQSFLDAWRYKRVIAKSMRGFSREVVIVDQSEFERLDSRVRSDLFEEL